MVRILFSSVSKRVNHGYNFQDMPHFTTGNKRMTNVSVGNGEYVSGIRKNENLGKEELMMSAGNAF